MFRHQQVVITQEDDSRPYFRALCEVDPSADHVLPFHILRVGFPGEDQLDRLFSTRQYSREPLWVLQEEVRALIWRKTARKSQSQGVGIECLGRVRKIFRSASLAR